jgi:hypothetical protein
MSYVHTRSISRMNLIMAGVGIVHYEAVEIAYYMISGARICVRRLVDAQRRCSNNFELVRDAVFVKMVPTIVGGASKLKAHLTLRS